MWYYILVPNMQQAEQFPRFATEGGILYRCNECGFEGDRPDRVYDHDGSRYNECEHCGSGNIAQAGLFCGVCGKPLYEGESAYQEGELLFCADCLTEVFL